MDTQKALEVLIAAVNAANLKGAYTLQDSAVIAEAVKCFTGPAKQPTTPPETSQDGLKPKKK